MSASEDPDLGWMLRDLARAPDAALGSVPNVEFSATGVEVSPPPPLLAPGALLGDRFEIVELLGRGGMGEVYRARDRRLDRDVAIKILLDTDLDRRKRFEFEARAASAIHHEHVHAIYDVATHEGAPFLVLELVDGTTLRAELAGGRLAASRALTFGRQIAEGLGAAHAAGVIHRDLKPENLVLTRDGRIKIVDFGLAKLMGERRDEAEGSLTVDGALLGTVAYMSPEQARGERADHRSDLFALGAILVELLTGRPAFPGSSSAEQLSAILRDDPAGLEDLPIETARVLRRCLAKQPAARFQSATDLAFALAQLDSSRPPPRRAPDRRGLYRNAWLAAGLTLLAGVGVLAVLGVRSLRGTAVVPRTDPAFARLTFRRGVIQTVRYAPDHKAVVYSGAWEGAPAQVFTTEAGLFESRALGLDAELLAVSATGELLLKSAVSSRSVWGFWTVGRLTRAPLHGGTPREVADDVSEADLGVDGRFAIVRVAALQWQIEWPIGKVVYKTSGWIGQPRISPDGTRLAFIAHSHPEDDGGTVDVIGADGTHVIVSQHDFLSIQGLAWAPSGRDLLFTAASTGATRELRSVPADGGQDHLVYRAPTTLRILDVAPDGRMLISRDETRVHMTAVDPVGGERDLSWLDGSTITSFSGDDRLISFAESWDGAGAHYGIYVRPYDGGPAIRVGDGNNSALTWSNPPEILLTLDTPAPQTTRTMWRQPIGTGQPRPIDVGNTDVHWMRWLPGDRSILLILGDRELARVSADGGAVERLGIHVSDIFNIAIDPRGTQIAAVIEGAIVMVDLNSLRARPILGPVLGEVPTSFSADSARLVVADLARLPASYTTIDLATGARTTHALAPRDRAGVPAITGFVMSHDGTKVVFSYVRTLSTAYEARDLLRAE
ncbi:MAG: serine/threonine-protein kinase [Myxococcales bacterium]|nr:serine/threonine-protein kinase [Myxococcales bacterium]